MKFLSKYSNDKEVEAAQYITEIICEKKAKIEKKDLHFRFWLNKEWSKFYRTQICTAHKLVKQYNPVSIVRALNRPEAYRIYSLRSPLLITLTKQEETKLSQENTSFNKKINRNSSKEFRKPSIQNNIFSKIQDIDNES